MVDYTNKTIYLGIDVHKASYSVAAVCDGEVVKRDKLKASPDVLLAYCQKAFKGAFIKSAYEAGFSGFYLHRFLISNSIDNIVVHAASIETAANNTVKTDKRDALKIATHLKDQKLHCVYVPSEVREDLRYLTRLRENLVRQKRRIACQIKSLLHLQGCIPFDSKATVTEKLLNFYEKMSFLPNFSYSFRTLSKLWKIFKNQIKEVNTQIANNRGEDIWIKEIYKSIPGIGSTSASVLLNELEDTMHFSNENKLFCYSGFTPKEHSSGEHKRQGHISKQGKPIIRKVLVQCAWKAIKKDTQLGNKFQSLSLRVGKKRAIVAIARILLGLIRSCMKRKSLYMPLKDKLSYQELSVEKNVIN